MELVRRTLWLCVGIIIMASVVACKKDAAPTATAPPPENTATWTASPTPTNTPTLACTVTPIVTATPEGIDAPNACVSAMSLGALAVGQKVVTGTLMSGGDNDYYSFQASVTGTFTFMLDCIEYVPANLVLYNDACDTGLGSASGTPVLTFPVALTSGNTYRLNVFVIGSTVTAGYRLTIIAP